MMVQLKGFYRKRIYKKIWLQIETQGLIHFIIEIQKGRIQLGLYYQLILDWR